MTNKINLEDLDWKDVKTVGFPDPDQKVIMHTQAIYTGTYESDNKLPPKGNWVVDKNLVLNDTRWAAITDDDYETIKKEYW